MFEKLLKSSKITILLPDSFLENESTLFLKTLKIGTLARLFSIYRIHQILFYNDNANPEDIKISKEIFNFLSIAPYLRKESHKSKYLQFSAILPPIQTPNQIGYENEDYYIKDALIIDSEKLNDETYSISLNLGENKPVKTILLNKESDQLNSRMIIPVKIKKYNQNIEMFNVSNIFWRFHVQFTDESLNTILNHIDIKNNLMIAASKYGEVISMERYLEIKKQFKEFEKIYLLIGPTKGSFKHYLQKKKFEITKINHWINFIEDQGTKTVKIEEALSAALAILNLC